MTKNLLKKVGLTLRMETLWALFSVLCTADEGNAQSILLSPLVLAHKGAGKNLYVVME